MEPTIASARAGRARPLAAVERRASIIDAVIPLLIERGRDVTSREIADAAGVAEGTIFRAFADKDEIIEAAVAKFLDPEPVNARIRAIDPELTLEQKVNDILFILRSRMTGVMGIMHAVGMTGRPPVRANRETYYELIGEVLGPDLASLSVTPERVAQFMRLLAFSSVIPQFSEDQSIPTDELARLITYGIAGHPAEGSPRAS